MAVAVISGFTWVNQFRNNANMFQGKGVSNSWTYNTKTNLSVGQVAGNLNVFPTGVNIINDPDLFDHMVNEGEIKPPIGPSIAEVV